MSPTAAPDPSLIEPAGLTEIEATHRRLAPHLVETPTHRWQGSEIAAATEPDTEIWLKLELLQRTGSFKARGALNNLLSLDAAQLKRGVTAVSAGNHAIAVAFAAERLGSSAKVVMMKSANPLRVQRCREFGAEIVLAEDVHDAFAKAKEIENGEGRAFVHPYEGPVTAMGPATLGYEWLRQTPDLDALIVPIGGGGLIAGIAMAAKQMKPEIKIYGVEPEGADSMYRSFAAGSPQKLEKIATIADSLGAPFALPYSFGLCRRFVDALVRIDDAAMMRAMGLIFREAKLAVEPAGAAATAALCGPLRTELAGQRVGIILCGANIDAASFLRYLTAAA